MLEWLKKESSVVSYGSLDSKVEELSERYRLATVLKPKTFCQTASYDATVWFHFGSQKYVLTIGEHAGE